MEEPGDVEIEIDAEIAGGEPDLPEVEVVGVPIHADPNRVVVDGEEITPETPLRQMRAAAEFLKLPGGSKMRVWAKLVNYQVHQAAHAAELAAALMRALSLWPDHVSPQPRSVRSIM